MTTSEQPKIVSITPEQILDGAPMQQEGGGVRDLKLVYPETGLGAQTLCMGLVEIDPGHASPWCVHERRATIEDGLQSLLIGENPLDVARLNKRMVDATRSFTRMWAEGAIAQAMSGIDIALWDIAGKEYGVPVWQLLGGKYRDEILCYAVGFNAADPGRGALEMRERGYTTGA